MPISTLIASGTTAATSVDTTLVDGAVATLVLTGEGTIFVEAKTVAGAYITVQSLTTKTPVQKVYGPLVFRARREVVQETFAPGGIAPTVPPVGIEAYTDAPMGGFGAPLEVASPGIGAPSDTAANTDTGTFSLVALVKRGLQNWTTLLARIPALVSGAQPVIATPRTCLGTFRLSVTSTATTLPALVMAVGGPGIPSGAVVCELQADGATIRLSRDNTVTPTTTTGARLDDGVFFNIDSTLSHVRLIAASTTPVNCTFFDRV